MGKKGGFTLIELMIVIAIIAIIAAIAIPGIIAATRAANEKNAIGSLKAVMNAENMFKQQVNVAQLYPVSYKGLFAAPLLASKYWVLDMSGLNRITVSSSSAIALIDFGLATADSNAAGNTGGPAMPSAQSASPFSLALYPTTVITAPKAGYRIGAMTTDEAATIYSTNGVNTAKFGFMAFPDVYGTSGKLCFVLKEDGTIRRRDPGSSSNIGSGAAADPGYRFTLGASYNTMPADTDTAWSKID